ncbi:uncharacterized protein IUM83_08569 [Phytophthora cinnamomi]|uniref:uncharacterized protein n=1 Tax=Phytophthora cinnamomi TaxID=4785 RepID=UPI00355A50C2|nr:hypothetical protein IUM83_08569 [Phytophthora cinnamomi]
MEEEAVAANEAAIQERRHEIRTSLRAVENSLREAGAVTDGYNSAYLLESTTAHWDNLPSGALFRRQAERVSDVALARSAALRFDFDAPDAVRYHWRVTPLGADKCRRIWRLFDADEDEVWTHREFLEYMAALKYSAASPEMKAFEDNAEVWRMYMSDMCELDEDGGLTFDGFVMYRELIEDEQPLARDLSLLGIPLEWEELERVESIKQLFDEYVDDPSGNVTARAAQYLLAEIGVVLTSEETTEIIERRYQLERCLRFVHQLKRTLRLFGYRQKSTLRFTNEGLGRDERGHIEEESKICRAGLLSLVFSSWSPAVKTILITVSIAVVLCTEAPQAASSSRTPGADRGDYLLKVDVGPKFSTNATIHLTYNSDADSAAALHELKYLERGAECFLYVDFTCRNGTKESDGQLLVERLTWFIGEYFREHIETLPYFHRWFVTLPTKIQLRLGPTSSGAAGTSAMVIRLVILFTARDNPFEHKQFVLAGKQDGSLSVLKFIKENSDTDFNVQLKMIQIYPGLVSGTHDAIRDISVPVRSSATATDDDFFEFCTVSEMRWRTWRIKVEDAPQRYRMQWPSLKESLGFPAFALRVSAFKDFTVLPNHESNPSEKNDCDSSDKQRVCEEMQEEVSNVDHTERSEEEQRRSGPATLQERIEAEVMEKSYLQAQAEMARFGAGSGSQGGMERPNNQTPSPVIPHVVDKYDPDHPDADWGGYVRRSAKKRFYTNQSSAKDNLTYDEKGGIMPRDPADSSSTSGKKLFEPKQNSSGDQVPGIPFQSAVYQVGPGNNVGCSDWKTSYALQTSMEATPKDNYVLGTRQNSQHKRHVAPMYEQGRGGRQNSARAQSPSTPWESGQGMPPPLSGSCSSGSLSGRRIDSRRSLLAGIGKLVAAEDLSGILPPERHLPESYTNPTSKTLLAENYHGTTLGYTGRRKY